MADGIAVQYDLQLILVSLLITIILGSFYVTLDCMKVFDGSLADKNSIKPLVFKLPARTINIDTNLFEFSVLSIVRPDGHKP